MFFKKLKAGSLQLVTGIMALIAILLLMLLLYINVMGKVQQNRESQLAAIHQLDYVNKFLNDTRWANETNLDLGAKKSLQIKTKPWGMYEVASIESVYKNQSYHSNALIGHYNPISNRLAMILHGQNQDLNLLQDVILKGDVYLQNAIIKPGNLGDFFYNTSNEQDYNLKAKSNSQTLIKLEFKNHLSDLFNGAYQNQAITEKFNTEQEKFNSFDKPTLFIYDEDDIFIHKGTFKGNIVIQTPKNIKIGANANLDNVILIANNLEVMPNFKGSFQAFAKSQIKIHNQVHLTYPSALILYPHQIAFENKITCDEGAIIEGTLAFLSDENLADKTHQSIDIKNADLKGQIYTDKHLSFSGNLEGHIIAEAFIFKFDFRSYINHINKLHINANAISEIHLGLPFVNAEKAVLKWVN